VLKIELLPLLPLTFSDGAGPGDDTGIPAPPAPTVIGKAEAVTERAVPALGAGAGVQ
jgi:hypothetical protein